jgi:hypothetical protein
VVEDAVRATDPVDRSDALGIAEFVRAGGPADLRALRERPGDDTTRPVLLIDDQPPALADTTAEDDTTARKNHAAHPYRPCNRPPRGKCAGLRQPWRMNER